MQHQNLHAPISILHLFFAALCPISVILTSYAFKLNIEKKLLSVVIRCTGQVFVAGYVLLSFLFAIQNPLLVFTYLTIMASLAALEASCRVSKTYPCYYCDALITIVISGAIFGVLSSVLVFNPNPWWNPKIIITTCGVLIGNSISGPSVAVDKFLSSASERRHEIETRLAFGATGYEASLLIIRSSISTAVTHTLNRMSVAGLVAIPGSIPSHRSEIFIAD